MKACRKCDVGLTVENWYPSYAKTYNDICKECAKAYARRYNAEHKEWKAAYGRQHYLENKGRYKARARRRREEKPEECRKADRRWREENPEKKRENGRRYDARKLNATIGEVDYVAIHERDKVCVYCGADEDLTIDHVVALTRGGPHCQENLVVACRSCNSSKNDTPLEEWLLTQPRARAWVMQKRETR